MSEKRFVIDEEGISDNKTDKWYCWKEEVVDLLNEQQTTLQSLKEENEKLIQNKCIPCELVSLQVREIDKLKEENEQLRKYNGQLKERLEKINGGYGHLTYRNGLTANEWLIESQERELKKKNEQISALKEENERLRNELDCFHPVMFQDMRKGTVVLYLKELK